jgi:Transcriptional regulators
MQNKIRIKDIAERAGVSTGTVDRILHNRGKVSKKAREAVEKVLSEVDYKPNIHISGMSLKRKYRIIITMPHIFRGEYWESIQNGILRALEEYQNIRVDYQIITYNQYDIFSCRSIFDQIIKMEADAMIIGPTFAAETVKLTNELDKRSIPYIFVDSAIKQSFPLAFFFVRSLHMWIFNEQTYYFHHTEIE